MGQKLDQKLDKVEQRELIDRVTKHQAAQSPNDRGGRAALQLGHQSKADWVRLLGLSHDPHDDATEIALDGITVPRPREIQFDGTGSEWTALDIRDAEGVQHILELKELLLLPAS